jgi:hypothetical protein
VALIEWVPPERLDVANVAMPLLRVAVPIVTVPSLNVTVPVAVEGETVAVKVTASPNVDGFLLDATEVVVLFLPLKLTVIVRKLEGRL